MFIILTAIGAILLLLAGVYLFQGKLVFFPMGGMAGNPSVAGLDYREVEIRTRDEVRLHGWFVPGDDPAGCVLFFHGNAGNISHRLDTLRMINELGLSVLIFDYRGYGKSAGEPSEEGTYLDAEAGWEHLVGNQGFEPGEIILWGRSMGAAVAAYLATEVKPAGLILESSFTSVPDMGRKLYPFLPIGLIARIEYPVVKYVRDAGCPVLVIHSPDDEIVPFRMGRKVYEAASEPKEFLEISGSHNAGFLLSGETYVSGVENFLDRVLPGKMR